MLIMSFHLSNDPGCCVTNDNVMVNLCNSPGKRIRSFVEREKRWGFVFDNLVPAKWKNYFLLIMSAGAQCIYTCIHVLRVNLLEHRHIESWQILCIVLFKCCLGNISGTVLSFKWYRSIIIFVLLMEFMFLNRFNKSVIVQNSYVFADRVILVCFSTLTVHSTIKWESRTFQRRSWPLN